MARYAHDSVMPLENSEKSKKDQVSDMFDVISPRYDMLNRLLSGGIDVKWRKKALRELKDLNPREILDAATGTGDVAIMAAGLLNAEKINGIDISDGMLKIGREKILELGLQNRISLLKGDSEAIPFADNSFDAVTVAFGVRNFQDLEKGLKEMRRVLRPGGKIVILEFSKPSGFLTSRLYDVYMKSVTPLLGKLFSGNRKAYSYLDKSIRKFPEGRNFVKILSESGYIDTDRKSVV